MTRTALAAATLALTFIASVPAMAGCRSAMVTDLAGNDGYHDTQIGGCAYWGDYGRGDRQTTTGRVFGHKARVVTANLGYGSRSHVDSLGGDARIATQMRSGAVGRVFNRGANDIVMHGATGSRSYVSAVGSNISVQVHGTNGSHVLIEPIGNSFYIRSEAW